MSRIESNLFKDFSHLTHENEWLKMKSKTLKMNYFPTKKTFKRKRFSNSFPYTCCFTWGKYWHIANLFMQYTNYLFYWKPKLFLEAMEPKQPWVPKKFYPYSLQAYLHSKVDESMWYKDNKYSRHMIEEKKCSFP